MLPTEKAVKLLEEKQDRSLKRKKLTNKILAFSSIAMFVATLLFRIISLKNLDWVGDNLILPGNHYFIYANLMHASVILMSFAVGILVVNQEYKYFPYINKKERAKLDEREADVRRSVIERSYTFFFVSFFLILWSGLYRSFQNKPMNFAEGDFTFIIIALILLVSGLPSILAAFNKKS